MSIADPKRRKGQTLGITRRFDAQVAPGGITQLEWFRANWGFGRYLSSRSPLYLKYQIKDVKTPGEVAAAAASG